MGRFRLRGDPADVAEDAAEDEANETSEDTEPTSTQPTSVTCQLSYTDVHGNAALDSVGMSIDANSIWSGTWDSTPAGPGRVEWVVFSRGNGVVASTEGSFQLEANSANLGGP
jgi:hypothetical protein